MTQIRFTVPVALTLGTIVLLSMSCGDDPAGPPRPPIDFLIGIDVTLAEAVEQALPGDTFSIMGEDSLTATQVIPSDKTPLLIRAFLAHGPLLRGPSDQPILRFESPAEGTRIVGIHFRGGSSAVEVQGGGHLQVVVCAFRDGDVQVLAGGGSVVEVVGSLMEDAADFSIQAMSGARIESTNNTIVGAGDCGIFITGNATGQVKNCIVHDSINYGVACTEGGSLDSSSGCNDIYSNVSGSSPYLNCTKPDRDFSLDPEFCDELGRNYQLFNTSPCTPANSPGGCGLVGFTAEVCAR